MRGLSGLESSGAEALEFPFKGVPLKGSLKGSIGFLKRGLGLRVWGSRVLGFRA